MQPEQQVTQGALTDVPGLRVGHAQRTEDGWLTGVTVVLPPADGAVAGVDVRGGGPGTRETDALDPRNLVDRVHAVVLTGGSAFGLAAASGVTEWLEEQGHGFRVGPEPGQVVPLVPAAVLFDLGRGGQWRARPDAALGRQAAEAAGARGPDAAVGEVGEGTVGAGTGAVVGGGLKGGVGTASMRLPSGVTVGALVVVNAAGSVLDPSTGALYGDPSRAPSPERHAAALRRMTAAQEESARRSPHALAPPLNTTLAVLATDADLSPSQAQKVAGCGHDGLARAIRPFHLMTDGDTVFALSTGARPLPEAPLPGMGLNEVLIAGADVLTRAVVRATRTATTTDTPGGVFPSYLDLYGPET